MALTKLLYVFPTCLSSFPHWTELSFCLLSPHYKTCRVRWMTWQHPSKLKEEISKGSAPTSCSLDWPHSPWNQVTGSRKGRGKPYAWLHRYILWERTCLCVVGVREDFCAKRRKLCSGTRSRPALAGVTKIRRNSPLNRILLHLHWRMANSSPQCGLPHFCWVVTLGMCACN